MRRVAAIAALAVALSARGELRLELTRQSLTGAHYRYREYVSGVPRDEFVTERGAPRGIAERQQVATPEAAPGTRYVDGRLVQRVIRYDSPLEPWAYDYDAATGALVQRVPLFFRAKPARIFDPNPVVTLNDPTLADQNDSAAAVPPAAYRDVEIDDAAESGPLRGPYVALVDTQPPQIAPPDAAGSLVFNRADDGFEDVSAYVHIDRSQRYLQSLGYSGPRAIAPYAVEVDAHAASGRDDSFFIPSAATAGEGSLYFGEGGTDDAEDADIVVHEYGHAILEWISPGTFGGTFASESRAISEGFGDYWAFSAHVAQRLATGRDPYCFADWDARCAGDDPSQQCAYPAGADCLRRLDSSSTMADYDRREASGVEHRNGTIWSSALREIFTNITASEGFDAGKRTTDTLVIESLFDAPPHPTFAAMARRLLDTDRLLFGGRHTAAICAAMSSRGIITDCASSPRGELTWFPSGDRGMAIPDNDPAGVTASIAINDTRAIEQLFVRVDIAHTARGDLRIELIAPDGTVFVLSDTSFERAPDIHVLYGRDTQPVDSLTSLQGHSAAGVWRLRVIDRRFRDVGTLLSWVLVIRFQGVDPAATRPRGATSQMIPVVGHVEGIGRTLFASDVALANSSDAEQNATLIFTPSGENGVSSFSAINLRLAPGETAELTDILQSAFGTVGIGSLEVLGDVGVMSRTWVPLSSGGRLTQEVPPLRDTTELGATPLEVAALDIEGYRFNAGVTETQGGSGVVRIHAGATAIDVPIQPFSHVQIPVSSSDVAFEVVSGDARIGAYVSQIDASGDAMFIEASEPRSRMVFAPAIGSTPWSSDMWLGGPSATNGAFVRFVDATGSVTRAAAAHSILRNVVADFFGRPGAAGAIALALPRGTTGATRVTNGATTELVPYLDRDVAGEQQLLFVESSASRRTNIGIVADAPAAAEVVVYDASGDEVQRTQLWTPGGLVQTPVTVAVLGGRAVVHVISGTARAYASVIDNITGDASFFAGN